MSRLLIDRDKIKTFEIISEPYKIHKNGTLQVNVLINNTIRVGWEYGSAVLYTRGIKIKPDEFVYYKNGNKFDVSSHNLEVRNIKDMNPNRVTDEKLLEAEYLKALRG